LAARGAPEIEPREDEPSRLGERATLLGQCVRDRRTLVTRILMLKPVVDSFARYLARERVTVDGVHSHICARNVFLDDCRRGTSIQTLHELGIDPADART
jgi:hypothetical protein